MQAQAETCAGDLFPYISMRPVFGLDFVSTAHKTLEPEYAKADSKAIVQPLKRIFVRGGACWLYGL